jgi:uncharacterized heparinase superfamily protein
MSRLAHFFHTISHLQRAQIKGRLLHFWHRRWRDPAKLQQLPPSPPPELRGEPGPFLPPAGSPQLAADLLLGNFRFLNETRELGQPINWEAPGASPLWQENLHYHDWLWDLDFAQATKLFDDWLKRVPPARGVVAWQPYPVTVRLINWCTFFLGRHRAETLAQAEFKVRLWHAFRQHAHFLSQSLEVHVGGHHLLENGVALAFTGAYWAGEEAAAWRALGLAVMKAQLAEQMLDDGTHYERSPMYHSRVLWLLLALQASGHPELQAYGDAHVHGAARAMRFMTHPDGELALFNDSAFGIYTPPAKLLEKVGLGLDVLGSFALHNSGYFGSQTSEGHYLICDAGRLGPDHIPGHAHGDVFSFELSWRGRRWLTDTGVHDYQASEERRLARATASHNTVTVNGQDQGEFWDVFRLAKRPNVTGVRFDRRPNGFALEGCHDGYLRLPCHATHRRRLVWHESGVLMVRDELFGAQPFKAASYLHLHPDCQVRLSGDAHAVLHLGEEVLHLHFAGPGKARLTESPYYPRFGVSLKRPCLVWEIEGRVLRFGYVLSANGDQRLDLDRGTIATEINHPW